MMPGRWIEAGRVPAVSAKAGPKAMPLKAANDDPEKARRFRDAALPHLDAAYTLARYLLRDATDAEDAVQECFLRAFKHFDSYRGPAMKPGCLRSCAMSAAPNSRAVPVRRPARSRTRPKALNKRRCGTRRRKHRRPRCCGAGTPTR